MYIVVNARSCALVRSNKRNRKLTNAGRYFFLLTEVEEVGLCPVLTAQKVTQAHTHTHTYAHAHSHTHTHPHTHMKLFCELCLAALFAPL